ncbi:MAG: copper chaperone PCu(A)C [Pseudomonadota bacterium]
MQIRKIFWLTLCFGHPVLAGGGVGIAVSDAYARAAPPGAHSAIFMTLDNRTAKPHALVKAESPAAQAVELHVHVLEDGMMEMRPVPRLELPANQRLTLEPGGAHVMLIGLTGSLSPGQQIPLTLEFEDGSRQALVVPVKAIATPDAADHHH